MANTTMPSTKMLPMDDVAEVLKVKYNFSSKEDIAKDTSKVGGTNSDLIAIAATNDVGALVKDRETIKNALNLAGTPASEYMTRTDGARIEDFGTNVSEVFANEFAQLRDEVYQMRGELTRQGLLTEYGPYAGFQDFFRVGDKKYQVDSLGGIAQNSTSSVNVNTLYPERPEAFKVGDWFIIHKIAQNSNFLVRVTKNQNQEITFERTGNAAGIPSSGIEVGNVELFKFLGEYNKGSFSFSKVVENALTNKERHTMLNDDSRPKMEMIEASNSGYAASFNVPELVGGALKSFSVMARSVGSPGGLTCYVLEDRDENLVDIKSLEIEEVGPTKRVKAKSNLIPASKAALPSPTTIEFDFQNPIDGSYPLIAGKTRYLFVVVAQQSNSGGDRWEVQFSKSAYDTSNVDLQTNNKAYHYKGLEGFTPLTTVGDLIFTLTTIEVKKNDESPYEEGLYTSEPISSNSEAGVSRARLTMRINREGNFISEESGTVGNGGVISILHDPAIGNGAVPSDLGIRGGDKIIVGTNIRTATTDSRSMQITMDKGLYVDHQASIYRMGYRVFLRAYKKVWNPTTFTFDESNHQLVEMPLIAVMPDRFHVKENYSDRLVFECEFRDEDTKLTKDVNMFELQVVWSSHISRDAMVTNPDLIGRIYDLTLSLDRTL